MTTDAEALHNPIASNPDISGIGVRIAAYAHIAITSVLLSYFRDDFELFREVGRRTCIVATAIAIASAWQCRTTGLSSLDTASLLAVQNMMGVYGATLTHYKYRRGPWPDLVFYGWLAAFVSWMVVTPLDPVLDVCSWWSLLIVGASSFAPPCGKAIVYCFNRKRDEHSNTFGVQLPVEGMFSSLPSTMAFVELMIYNNVEAGNLNQWTYGQMLPMLLLALPTFELLSEIWKRRSLRDRVTREGLAQRGSGTEDPPSGNIL